MFEISCMISTETRPEYPLLLRYSTNVLWSVVDQREQSAGDRDGGDMRHRRALICARGATNQPAVAGIRCAASTAAQRISVEPLICGTTVVKSAR
jgi:hypothetical protein